MNPDQYRQVFGTLRRIDVQEQAVLITCEVVAMLSVMIILGPLRWVTTGVNRNAHNGAGGL